jgi:hypothetical protein
MGKQSFMEIFLDQIMVYSRKNSLNLAKIFDMTINGRVLNGHIFKWNLILFKLKYGLDARLKLSIGLSAKLVKIKKSKFKMLLDFYFKWFIDEPFVKNQWVKIAF